jgi:intracellular sulfur oxidation DsrE/DsrF family protein
MSQNAAGTHRRGFLAGIAAGTATLLAGRWSKASAEIAPLAAPGGDEWLSRIKGKHRQVFDCTSPNEGFGVGFGVNYTDTLKEALKVTDADVTPVIVLRHFAMPLAMNDRIWAKYKIGELINVKDPKTNAFATRNIFRDNVPLHPGLTYEQLATRGMVICACNLALNVVSGMQAPKAGVTPEVAKKEWTAGLLAGVTLVPSGVYAVNRAQETGCTYCYGG